MNKDVVVSISGMQFENADDSSIEVITTGEYFEKNNKHYLYYDEVLDGSSIATKNTVKFDNDCLELKRKGAVNVHMIFDKNQKTMSNYNTPFGNLVIGIDTSDIIVQQSENNISVNVDYALDINYEFLTTCQLKLNIKARE